MKRFFYLLLIPLLFACNNSTNNDTTPADDQGPPDLPEHKAQVSGPAERAEGVLVPGGKKFGASGTLVTLPKNNDGGIYKPNHGLKPGDIVTLTGDYAYINLDNVQGTAEAPIKFVIAGDSVRVGIKNSYGFIITNSKHFIIDGTNAAGKIGLKIGGLAGQYIAQSFTFPGSEKFEAMGMELKNAQVGFFANPKTAGSGPYGDIKIHDNYVHHIDNPSESGRSEGVYIGRTDVASRTIGGAFYNVEVYNNLFEGLAGDGIQIALCEGVNIHHNRIKGYGRANLQQQRSAIIVGGCTSGLVTDNDITDGTGSPIQIFGGGEVTARSNRMLRVATSANEDGFYIDGKCKDGKLTVRLIENTIDTVSRDYIRDATNSLIENTGNKFGKIKPPVPPITPPVSKPIYKTVILYTDSTYSLK